MLNRSPVLAMVLKSNRQACDVTSKELVVGRDDYVANIQTMSRDKIKLQLSQHFCRATKILCHATRVSCRVGMALRSDFYTFRSCNTCIFSFTTFPALHNLLLSSGIT